MEPIPPETLRLVVVALVALNEAIVPRLVKEEPTTEDPKVVASKTRALLMRKTLPVGIFTLPFVKVMPPAKEEVALAP